jgi:hypothetical protein
LVLEGLLFVVGEIEVITRKLAVAFARFGEIQLEASKLL